MTIDLNCDMGELPSAIADGSQEALMPFLTSVNIACGGHAGDPESMRVTIAQAVRWNVAIGAHPGYCDRPNFGRIAIDMPLEAVSAMVFEQLTAFAKIAAETSTPVRHVKPHGALYNSAVANRALARAIAIGVSHWKRDVMLVGLAGSPMLEEFQLAGFPTMAEAFADRTYEADGSLRPRRFADSLITDPETAVRQALEIVHGKTVTAVNGGRIAIEAATLCIHGDNPAARAIAERVSRALRANR